MDHREFLRSMTAEERRALTRRSDAKGLIHLAGHLGLIGLFAAPVALQLPFWPVLMLPLGISLIFLFTLLHEAVHKTPFASDWLNHAAAWTSGVVVTLPPEWFRLFHMAHHRYTQDPDHDPELADGGAPGSLKSYLWRVTGIPVWISQFETLFRNALGHCCDPFVPDASRSKITRESRWMLAVYATAIIGSVALQSGVLLYLWLIPLLLGQPFLRLYLMAEHGRCPFVADMFENTRTTFTNQTVRFIAWNMPYHAEHHAYPTVPFHNLPTLHDRIKEYLKVVAPDGYAGFHRQLAGDLAAEGR